MSVLAAWFGSSEAKEQDSDKLLHLFWNRAELKKEFAGMRKEQYRLQDRIKQQEGATARMQQKLEYLEGLLADPRWASSVLVFFQLRALARHCERKLGKFAEQLKQQREQKQHNSLLVRWNEQRSRERQVVEKNLATVREHGFALQERLQAERNRIMGMSGFLRFFRRRSVSAILDGLRGEIEKAALQEQELLETLEEIKKRQPPEKQGLDVATKRSINFMILAYAQQLFLGFNDNVLAAMAKEANDKSVGSMKYGTRAECQHLLTRIQKRLAAMDSGGEFGAPLRSRAQRIGEQAKFRKQDDAVPVATSVSTLYLCDADGKITDTDSANLLGENYWGIARFLSR